jgi:hypothetical protein
VGVSAKELHGTGTEPPQGFKRDCVECISRAAVRGKVVAALVSILKSSGMTRGAGGQRNIGSSQGMDERDVGQARGAGCSESPSVPGGGWGFGAQARSIALLGLRRRPGP